MQMNNEGRIQQNLDQGVYTDVATSYSSSPISEQQDNQEFSLSSIQQRLGSIDTSDELEGFAASPDLMPSSQTLNMSYQREYSEGKVAAATKMSTKTKVMIASYAIAVLALVLAVTLCSVSVSNAFGSVIAMDSVYTQVASELAELDSEILQSEDFARLGERAAELGYIDSTSSNSMGYSELETRPAQNFDVETNWFDSLCDWVCNVFGG